MLLEQWDLIVCDVQSEYGVDLGSTPVSWSWFLARLRGLLAADTRLSRHFAPDDKPEGVRT